MKKTFIILLLSLIAMLLTAQETTTQAGKEALAWMKGEIAKSKKQPLKDFNSAGFFNPGIVRFIGYIKGYDPEAGHSIGVVYASNELTREAYPITIEIQPDGRFDVNISKSYPSMLGINILGGFFSLYMEPDCILGAVFDWEDFPLAGKNRNRTQEPGAEFYGPLAGINSDIRATKLEKYNGANYRNDVKTVYPETFKKSVTNMYERNRKAIFEKAKSGLSEKSVSLLNSIALVDYGYLLMDFPGARKYAASENPTNTILKEPFPAGYYDFLQQMSLDRYY